MNTREPAYHSGKFYWRCAAKDASDTAVYTSWIRHLVPWLVYWGMTGGLGAYIAEYETREAALAAFRHGVEHPSED